MAEKKVTFPLSLSARATRWYGKLCSLMVEGSLIGMRETFNKFYPPLTLADKLASPNLRQRMETLHARGIFEEYQWKKLYPKNKKRIASEHYDLMLLSILLRQICHLSPPYPNGWLLMPEEHDCSISANIARVHALRKELLSKTEMSDDEALRYWSVILGALLELGGEKCLPRADKIYREVMTEEMQEMWISRLQTWQEKEYNQWHRNPYVRKRLDSAASDVSTSGDAVSTGRRPRLTSVGSAHRGGSSRLRRPRLHSVEGGLPKEECETLQKFYQPLVTNVKVPDIIEQLVKYEILTHEEQNAIYCNEKNRQRMDALITILYKKPANAYQYFVRAIKFKHSHLYEMMNRTYMALKKESMNNKPDNLRLMSELLRSHQRAMCSRWKAVPWVENIKCSIRDFYIQQQIISSQGQAVDLQDLFSPDDPQSVLIVGQSGTGKTTLCKRLIHDWLSDNHFLHNLFHLVFYMDLSVMKGTVKDHIFEQFTNELQLGKEELWQVIETNQQDVLFIFDDYDMSNDNYEVDQIAMKKMLPNCSVLMTSISTPAICKHFQQRHILLGLVRRNITDLVRIYMEQSNALLDQVSNLFQALQDETLRELAVKPFFCLCLCTVATTNGVDLSKITREMILLEQFVDCIKLKHSGNTREKKNLGTRTLHELQQTALQASLEHSKVLSCDQLKNEYDNNFVYQFGLLNRIDGDVRCAFVCKVLQDFLAAQHLKDMGATEFKQYCDRLVTDVWFYDTCRYVCGLRRMNKVLQPLKILVTCLADENVKHSKKICFMRNEKGVILGISEGRMMDFSLSLECLHEMIDRDDMCEIISKSLPKKLIVRTRGISCMNMILGLSRIIQINTQGPRELEILFDSQTDFGENAMLQLAKAMHSNYQVKFLKVEWKTDNLFAQFLSILFQENIAIDCVKLVDLYSSAESCSVPATVRADLQKACKSMRYVKKVSLFDCQAPMLVNSVIHGVPLTMEHLDLTSCTFNPVTSQELSYHLEHSKALTSLNLTNIHLEGMCFRYIMKGLRMNQSLTELNLRDAHIDKPGQVALAEALKFNHRLRLLDLSRNEFTPDGCIQLSQALSFNKTLRELVLLGSYFDSSYLGLMMAYKHPWLNIVEDSSRPPTARAVIIAD
ncbi:uncharacterized protein LOC135493721 isoform X2 [Lineus longissimus]